MNIHKQNNKNMGVSLFWVFNIYYSIYVFKISYTNLKVEHEKDFSSNPHNFLILKAYDVFNSSLEFLNKNKPNDLVFK